MAQHYSDRFSGYLRRAGLICLAAAGLGLAGTALGLARTELYQATVPVTDLSETGQSTAFQAALRVVLVRVTGRRTADGDPALAPLLSNARRYVQQYRGAADNKMWVAFDGPALERWLTQNNQPLWGHERPTTFVFVTVPPGAQGNTVVTAEDTSELKVAIDAAATFRGIPLIWPSAADVQRSHLDVSTAPAAVIDFAHAHGGDGVLLGHASNATATAAVRWTESYQDHSSEFSGTLEGVNRAADSYASLFAASGSLAPVEIEVAGVADLRDYASVQGYLESLTFISHVSVEGLTGDVAKFQLLTRGGLEALQHALLLSGKLQSLPVGVNAVQRFQLRR